MTDTSEITVTNAWIRPGEIDGPPTAAYMVIRNTGDGADRLLSISADFSESLEVHETQTVDDVARMVLQEDGIEIPRNATVEFRQGELHVMIMQLSENLTEGQEVELLLTFENAGEIAVPATVSSTGQINDE
ncbi:copper chaperone PCu(A)C [Phototrophicus methaneseepsis]|uniref:Copper chaperone PCu(A)C n=1 Tax=Phototrophicus methaneseepsis TaxID=2710758 RepID=A0A7S8EA82_9CHLR|nr:copper chaperone PCu(A)C [Phototrophicus methaneseepsis]QPC83093.1 copper chaperone PCu(A)C [Phototrophicus methaneseepsis]